MNCINCGAEYPNEKIPKFCIRCGNQLQKQASLIICPNCGRKSSSGGKCSNCYYVLTKREGNITRLISNISDKVDEIDKRLNTTERYVEDISRQLANKGVVAIDRVDIYEDIE
ncbi:MAG: zinc ribbon domain-containing protein, partial [Candidatus Heimdallarchaeota archaeon]|nr:zinc ribbon domain-containing protein [Candidatus Heimdallarchaeota archaeon]